MLSVKSGYQWNWHSHQYCTKRICEFIRFFYLFKFLLLFSSTSFPSDWILSQYKLTVSCLSIAVGGILFFFFFCCHWKSNFEPQVIKHDLWHHVKAQTPTLLQYGAHGNTHEHRKGTPRRQAHTFDTKANLFSTLSVLTEQTLQTEATREHYASRVDSSWSHLI